MLRRIGCEADDTDVGVDTRGRQSLHHVLGRGVSDLVAKQITAVAVRMLGFTAHIAGRRVGMLYFVTVSNKIATPKIMLMLFQSAHIAACAVRMRFLAAF